MHNLTYTLSSDSISTDGIDVYESGKTKITFDLRGIHTDSSIGYLKFIADFGDGSDQVTVQDITDTWGLSSQSISHIFYPGKERITSYSVQISGIKTDLTVDNYQYNVSIGKPSISTYKDVKIIETKLFTNKNGTNNLMVTFEMQDPYFVGNVIIPQSKIDITALIDDDTDALQELDLNKHLRTEVYSSIGGLQSITVESGQFIITENQLLVFVIANELAGIWSGRQTTDDESIAILIDDTAVITDINGNVIADPSLILIPEFDTPSSKAAIDYTRKTGLPYR